jgi:hypothetical protein
VTRTDPTGCGGVGATPRWRQSKGIGKAVGDGTRVRRCRAAGAGKSGGGVGATPRWRQGEAVDEGDVSADAVRVAWLRVTVEWASWLVIDLAVYFR